MDLNLSVFQEPRGVMRVFHFVFSICAFATTVDFVGHIVFSCKVVFAYPFSYPFLINLNHLLQIDDTHNNTASTYGNFGSDARFFVCTGVLAMLYSLAILIVYTKFDKLYKTNDKLPVIDFVLSVVLTILWLSSSAAWANGLTGLKHVTDPSNIKWDDPSDFKCQTATSGFGALNISVVFGFLNFFLWAANLWFLYKETKWFQKPIANPEV